MAASAPVVKARLTPINAVADQQPVPAVEAPSAVPAMPRWAAVLPRLQATMATALAR